jgi:NAD(P)H-dependent FMN reductase
MSDINVLALVGSLRAASVNHQIAALAAETAPAGITVTVYHGPCHLPIPCSAVTHFCLA